MTPWWSFSGLKQKLGRFKFMLFLLVIIISVGLTGYKIGGGFATWQQNKISDQEYRLSNLYSELDQKIRQINYLSVELEVEQRANEQIQQELLQIREESFALRRELNFYQKVLAPELVADGISVEQFNVEPTNIENRYIFRFALVQTNSAKRYAKGYIRLNLIVSQNEEKLELDLAELAQLSKNDLKFSFHFFQYFEGEFELAPGMIAEQLAVKVVQPKTKWQSYKAFTQKLDWPNLEL
ncbi:hypothetical protein KO505_03610 [Psychrosphaera sp. F3M07]|jgi:hypothetical protein|uniref:DUF6776 family protein n=1 Tax=Psychrosphaera aquimarina TaxID=2044854 RepID=A0ABU3R1F6_9GAMM|nr:MULTISPECIES: DUF6776 family protein [Psychrosphaera]MBU2917050.1 hypothetical protein [Psychrosphaera sp. F3M07]MDU0113526.1 DUF6776 family protein [Psychrosphaera aquimarina]